MIRKTDLQKNIINSDLDEKLIGILMDILEKIECNEKILDSKNTRRQEAIQLLKQLCKRNDKHRIHEDCKPLVEAMKYLDGLGYITYEKLHTSTHDSQVFELSLTEKGKGKKRMYTELFNL